MSAQDMEYRDEDLAKKVGDSIEETLESLHRAINQNRLEEIDRLGNTVENLCAGYRDLREIDV